MVIQRIQTLYLLVASLLMAGICIYLPGQITNGEVAYGFAEMMHLMIVYILVAVLLFIDMFLYNNLKLQMKVARVSIVLTLVVIALQGGICAGMPGVTTASWATLFLPVVPVILTFLALKGMQHDYKLLRDSDRLR